MWTLEKTELASDTQRYTVEADGKRLTVADWLTCLKTDATFRRFFNEALADNPWPAYFFETPPLTLAGSRQPVAWVLVVASALERMRPDQHAFEGHFVGEALAVAFTNLGGDARLVAPTPRARSETYLHLATFVREAPLAQRHAFWSLVAMTVMDTSSASPMWLSTSGLGVGWLHMRLDKRPKYYNHDAYTRV